MVCFSPINSAGGEVLGVLYIVSVAAGTGKTAIGAGLARNLTNEGRKVGYLPSGSDGDAAFMREVLGAGGEGDIVLAEGRLGPKADDPLTRDAYAAAQKSQARVIAVEVYSGRKSQYTEVYRGFGPALLGVVINKVPVSQLEHAAESFGAVGIKVLGVVPEDRALLAVSVGELAEIVGGKLLNNAEKAADLVENYMLGAMVVDSGRDYFARKPAKAAIVRADRPDMQLAALETPTRCLVLSGSSAEPPFYNVLQKAEARAIPVIATDRPTAAIVDGIEAALAQARCRQEPKLKRLAALVAQHLNLPALA